MTRARGTERVRNLRVQMGPEGFGAADSAVGFEAGKVEWKQSGNLLGSMAQVGTDSLRDRYETPDDKYLVDELGRKYFMVPSKNGNLVRVPYQAVHAPDDPLYEVEDIQKLGMQIKMHGRRSVRLRNYAYFVFSINTWRRAGDNLDLRICDVVGPDGRIKEYLTIREGKTQKVSHTYINEAARSALEEYLRDRKGWKMSDYLFQNTKPKYDADGNELPMEVQAMCKMLQRAAKDAGLPQSLHIGTHTLRKTGAYHAMLAAETEEERNMIADLLNHSSFKITQAYVRVEQHKRDAFLQRCNISVG